MSANDILLHYQLAYQTRKGGTSAYYSNDGGLKISVLHAFQVCVSQYRLLTEPNYLLTDKEKKYVRFTDKKTACDLRKKKVKLYNADPKKTRELFFTDHDRRGATITTI